MNSPPKRQDTLWSEIFEIRYWYLGSFLLFAIPSEIVIIIGEIAANQGIINTWRAIIPPSADAMTMSAGGAFMFTETGRAFMVLAHGIKKWFERNQEKRDNRLRAEGETIGMKKGETKANQAWAEWNARREAAEARGEPFSEPPPNGRL